MKYLIPFWLLLKINLTFGQNFLPGTFIRENPLDKNENILRIKFLSDSVFAFAFFSDSNTIFFNEADDFGIAHRKNSKWIGKLDYSFFDRDVGDFISGNKNGRYNNLLFELGDSVVVQIYANTSRIFVEGSYKHISSCLPSFNIGKKYKNIGYANLLYKGLSKCSLYNLPENHLPNKYSLLQDEIVNVENEYEDFVFIVKYNEKNEVVKYGWVNRKYLVFVKKIDLQ